MMYEKVDVRGYTVIFDNTVFKNVLKMIFEFDDKNIINSSFADFYKTKPDIFVMWYIDSDSEVHVIRNSTKKLRFVREIE